MKRSGRSSGAGSSTAPERDPIRRLLPNRKVHPIGRQVQSSSHRSNQRNGAIVQPRSKAIEHHTHTTRLLVVGPLPPPFIGPAVATLRLLNAPRMRESFELLFLDLSDREGVEGIGRVNLHNIRVAMGHACRSLGIVLRRRPDVLYIPIDRGFWGFLRDMAIMLPAWILGVRVVAHLRAGRFDLIHDFGFIGRMVARIGLATVDRMLVLGESLREIFGSFMPSKRIRVVPNGIDLDTWPRIDRVSVQTGRPTIAYLGNLFEDKGAHVMLQALPAIRRAVGDVVVEFAGDWIVDAYRQRCMELVESLGLWGNVRFPGRVDDQGKRDILRRADILAFVPVRPEGSPWVVLEGMAASLPVVGTPQGTMRETIVDGVTGFLVEPDDPAAVADCVTRLLVDDRLRREMGEAGRRRVENVYAETRTLERLIEEVQDASQSDGSVARAQRCRPTHVSPTTHIKEETMPW